MRVGIVAVAFLAAAPLARADTASSIQAANRAAQQCEAGKLDGASSTLRKLLRSLESELGPGHGAPQIVRLNLAHVERARGDAKAAAELEKLPPADPNAPPLDRKLKKALRGLHACGSLRPATRVAGATREKGRPSGGALGEISSGDHLVVARKLLTRGQYARALQTAELAQETAGAKAPAAQQARIFETLALIHLTLGDARRAQEAADTAEKLARATGDIELRITLARLVAQAGDLERAGKMLDEIAAGSPSGGARAELDEARGDLALRLGAPRQALGHLERARAGHRKQYGRGHPSTAAVEHLRGDAFRLAGDFPSARAAYAEALKVRTAALGEGHPESARTQNAIGVLRADLRDWRGADSAFAAALASANKNLGADNPETITIRANRAFARWGATGKCNAAKEYASATDALSKVLGEQHPSVATAVYTLSRIEFDCGNTQRAEALLQRALAAQRKSLGASHPALANTRLQRGRLLAHRGQLGAAAGEIEQAISVLGAGLGPEHPAVARARTTRARLAAAQGDASVARREALEASRAIAIHTRLSFGAIPDRQRAQLAKDSEDVVGALLSVPGAPAKELYVSLLPHRDSVLRSVAASRASTRGEFLGELQRLRLRYVAAIHSQRPDTAARVKALADQIDGLERLAAAAGSSVPNLDPSQVLTLACQRLPSDAALVKYVAYDRTNKGSYGRRSPAYAALVVRGGSCDVTRVELGNAAAITDAAERFAKSMRDQKTDDEGARKALAKLLLAPLRAAVSGTRRWLVIPDGVLWGVPVGALPDPEDPGRYVLERVTVGYLTSTYELAESKPGSGGSLSRSLLIGAPDFGSAERGGPVVLTSTGPCRIEPFEKLPGTRQELGDISELISAKRTLTGADASKAGLEKALARKPWLIHFATHAYFAGLGGCETARQQKSEGWSSGQAPIEANPLLLSGIVMAGANNPTRVDAELKSGILTAYEVAGLDLRSAGLVVLSACDTGTGLQLRGQEVQGLRWGFRAAGARALVTSLWRSNDVATRKMMKAFYEALASGELEKDPLRGAEALRRAQLAQLESEHRLGVRRPLTWANFIFSGVL